jgi:hypothetical protein
LSVNSGRQTPKKDSWNSRSVPTTTRPSRPRCSRADRWCSPARRATRRGSGTVRGSDGYASPTANGCSTPGPGPGQFSPPAELPDSRSSGAHRARRYRDRSMSTHRWTDENSDVDVRHVQPYQADKTYRCPGCDHEIRPGEGHEVVVPRADPDLRRHWHSGCWFRATRAGGARSTQPSMPRMPPQRRR